MGIDILFSKCNIERYTDTGQEQELIISFRDKWLENFYLQDRRHRKIPADLEERLFRKLQILDDARHQNDFRSPPSNHFESLRGKLKGKSSIRVNDQWRLIFKWDDTNGTVNDVYLDNHSYR